MDSLAFLEQWIKNEGNPLSPLSFLINLGLGALLALILAAVYIRFGKALSSRHTLARNFVMLTLTTMFIITVVKASLALSLGLVGALSIVRFRAAIKEPEELAYLFFCIAIGLGLGADQRLTTLIAFGAIIIAILSYAWMDKSPKAIEGIFLALTTKGPEKLSRSTLIEHIGKAIPQAHLKRLDEQEDRLEVVFRLHIEKWETVDEVLNELKKLDPHLSVSILDTAMQA